MCLRIGFNSKSKRDRQTQTKRVKEKEKSERKSVKEAKVKAGFMWHKQACEPGNK